MGKQIKTLADLKKVAPMFGPSAISWVELKISESSVGENEEVIADDTQIMFLLLSLAERDQVSSGQPV